jgi:hypothetical protein
VGGALCVPNSVPPLIAIPYSCPSGALDTSFVSGVTCYGAWGHFFFFKRSLKAVKCSWCPTEENRNSINKSSLLNLSVEEADTNYYLFLRSPSKQTANTKDQKMVGPIERSTEL